jgi:hypothetical protein
MQCPACGYDGIDEGAFFCPNCRHQFREPENDVYFDRPENDATVADDYCQYGAPVFTEKEIRRIEVQLLQPAILVMLVTAAALYLTIGQVPVLAVHAGGFEIHTGGLVSFFAGVIAGWIFYRVALYRVE